MNTVNVQNHECSDEYAQKVGRSLSGADEEDLPVPRPQPSARRGTLAAIFGTGGSESNAIASPAENEPVNGIRRKGSSSLSHSHLFYLSSPTSFKLCTSVIILKALRLFKFQNLISVCIIFL